MDPPTLSISVLKKRPPNTSKRSGALAQTHIRHQIVDDQRGPILAVGKVVQRPYLSIDSRLTGMIHTLSAPSGYLSELITEVVISRHHDPS